MGKLAERAPPTATSATSRPPSLSQALTLVVNSAPVPGSSPSRWRTSSQSASRSEARLCCAPIFKSLKSFQLCSLKPCRRLCSMHPRRNTSRSLPVARMATIARLPLMAPKPANGGSGHLGAHTLAHSRTLAHTFNVHRVGIPSN